MLKACRITVLGRVQGVAFRAATVDAANALGIKGNVRNLEDGGVYIEAQGDEVLIDKFIEWCRKGPPAAHVVDLIVEDAQPKQFSNFEVLR